MKRLHLAITTALAALLVASSALAEAPASALVDHGPSAPAQPDPTADQPGSGEPNVLIGPGDRLKFTGFGGMDARYSRILDRDAGFACVEGGLILNHALSIGIGGCGLASYIDTSAVIGRPLDEERLELGYGGAAIRYHLMSKEMVNVSIGALVGGGAITFEDETQDDDTYTDGVFVFEPQVGVHLNVTRWMRVAATGRYRFVRGVETTGMDDAALSNVAVGGNVQFGWF